MLVREEKIKEIDNELKKIKDGNEEIRIAFYIYGYDLFSESNKLCNEYENILRYCKCFNINLQKLKDVMDDPFRYILIEELSEAYKDYCIKKKEEVGDLPRCLKLELLKTHYSKLSNKNQSRIDKIFSKRAIDKTIKEFYLMTHYIVG